MDGIIDVSRLGDLENYSVTEAYQPRWDNVLVLKAYDRETTYLMTKQGEELLLRKRLSEVLHDLSQLAGVHQVEMQTLYKIVRGQTRGLIAGHYELVPTCGRGNQQVVYYMAHHLDHYQRNQANDGVLLSFHGDGHQLINVTIDACYSTFERLKKQADEVGKIQLEGVKDICGRFGIQPSDFAQYTSGLTLHERFLHREQYERVFMDQIMKVVQRTAERCYGEDFSGDFYSQLRRILSLF